MHTPTDSILWTFDRMPEIGEEIVLGDRGVYPAAFQVLSVTISEASISTSKR